MQNLADAGVPMLFIQLPCMAVLLVPVIAIESIVFRYWVPLRFQAALSGASIANLLSTFVGFPLAWLALVVLELALGGGSAWGLATPSAKIAAVTVQAAWLIPYEQDLSWMVPAASLVLRIPSFFVSVWVEGRYLKKKWVGIDSKRLWQAVWIANFASYSLLIALAGIYLLIALHVGKN